MTIPPARACFLAAVLVGVAASAAAAVSFDVGVKAGVNVAELAGDGVGDAGTKNGFQGGAFFGADFTEHFGARIEGLYAMRGAKGTIVTPGDDHAHETTWTLNALEFPILATGRAALADRLAIRGFAGPVLGFNVESEIETRHGRENRDGKTKDFDLAGTFGGGVDYRISRVCVGADVRYTIGATSIQEDVAGRSFDIETRGLGVLMELRLPLRSR